MNRKLIEVIIIISLFGFWIILIILGIKNQFNVPSVPSEKFETFLQEQNPIIIDLRESVELAKYPLDYQPLLHLPFSFLQNHLNWINIPQNETILYVCSDGNRARLIASLLQKQGCQGYYLRSGLHYARLLDTR
jgi:rhodanese-related sulfurtransferase